MITRSQSPLNSPAHKLFSHLNKSINVRSFVEIKQTALELFSLKKTPKDTSFHYPGAKQLVESKVVSS